MTAMTERALPLPRQRVRICIWPTASSQRPFIGDNDDMLNLEAAFVWGPFSMQGEYAQL